jgi:hypothetical protein
LWTLADAYEMLVHVLEDDLGMTLTSWPFWSNLSETESLAAVARVEREASESLATSLLAVEEAWEVAPWTDSET